MSDVYNKILNSIISNNINKFNKLIKQLDKNDIYIDTYILANLQIIFEKINNDLILIKILDIILNKNNYIYFLDILSNLPDNYKIINYNKYILINYIIKKNNKNINNIIILLNIFNIKMLNFIYNIDNDLFVDIISYKSLYGSYINIILTTIVLINLKLSDIINLNNYNNLNELIKDINKNTYLSMYMINNIYNSNYDFIKYNHFIQNDDYLLNIYDIYNNDEIKYKNDIIIDGIVFMLSNNDNLLFKYTYINNRSIMLNYKLIYYCFYYEYFEILNILLLNLFTLPYIDLYELTEYSSNITSIYFLIKSKNDKLKKYSNKYIYIKKLLDSIKSNIYII